MAASAGKAVLCVYCVGIWEPDETLSRGVTDQLARLGVRVVRGAHPGPLSAAPLDLLAAAPRATGWRQTIRCPMILLPGPAGRLARRLEAVCAVSYGTSHRDTLTFSSLEGNRIGLAVQRELVTLDGQVVERQELPLSLPTGWAPPLLLAAAGVLLLSGLPPEALPDAFPP